MAINRFANHPFKQGLIAIIYDHFASHIAKRFEIYLEVELYNPDHKLGQNLRNQIKAEQYIAEIHYRHPSGIITYICDIDSWWSKKQCEYALLKFITDKARAGEIGQDWTEADLKNISKDITSGKYETPDEEITKYMSTSAKEVKK